MYFVQDSPAHCVGDIGMMLLFGTTFPHDLAPTVFDNDHQLLHTTLDKVLVWSVVEVFSCQFGHLAVFNTLCTHTNTNYCNNYHAKYVLRYGTEKILQLYDEAWHVISTVTMSFSNMLLRTQYFLIQ